MTEGWQPIETAPRGGQEILCWDGIEMRVCYPKRFIKDRWEYFRDEKNAPGHSWSMVPTHWMPLPEAPTSEAE